MGSENWISLFGGVVGWIMGALLIRYRVAAVKFNADTQRTVRGRGDLIARRGAGPFWIAAVGVVFLFIGQGQFAMGLFHHVWWPIRNARHPAVVTVWLATIIVVSGAVFSAAAGATMIATRNRLGNWLRWRYALARGHDLDLPATAGLIVTLQRVLGLIGFMAILVGIAIFCTGLSALFS